MRGHLIVFEGADGAGKTTIAGRFASSLSQRGLPVLNVSFPGREPGTLGALVYSVHHDPKYSILSPTSIQLLHVAAHVDAIDRKILPALNTGTWVILDRYWWSTWAYGRAAGVAPRTLRAMLVAERHHWAGLDPSIVFLVTRRTHDEQAAAPSLVERVNAEYDLLARKASSRLNVIRLANETTIEDAVQAVQAVVDEKLRHLPQSEVGR